MYCPSMLYLRQSGVAYVSLDVYFRLVRFRLYRGIRCILIHFGYPQFQIFCKFDVSGNRQLFFFNATTGIHYAILCGSPGP